MSKSSLSRKNSVVSSANCWILVTVSRRSSRMALFSICISLISLGLILMVGVLPLARRVGGIGGILGGCDAKPEMGGRSTRSGRWSFLYLLGKCLSISEILGRIWTVEDYHE